jgi:hypothetical protein
LAVDLSAIFVSTLMTRETGQIDTRHTVATIATVQNGNDEL